MVSLVCAGLLLVIVGCSLKVCPFFYKTTRGLLCIHWTVINFLVSTSGKLSSNRKKTNYSGSQAIDSKCLLISLATLICLLEHVITVHKPGENLNKKERERNLETFLTPAEQMVICSVLLCFDIMCSMYGKIANAEISLLLLLSHFTLLIFIWAYKRNIGRKLTTQASCSLILKKRVSYIYRKGFCLVQWIFLRIRHSLSLF